MEFIILLIFVVVAILDLFCHFNKKYSKIINLLLNEKCFAPEWRIVDKD